MATQISAIDHVRGFDSVEPGTETSRPRKKRRRVALACSNCRHRKSRCDGRRPKCSLCSELDCDCQYEQAGTAVTVTVGKSFTSLLEERLRHIETSIKQLQSQSSPATSTSPIQDQHNFLPVHQDSVADSGDASHEHSDYAYPNPVGRGELDTAEDSIDGMGAMRFTDEEDCGYFGASSNIAFLRHISFALARENVSQQTLASPASRRVTGTTSVSRQHSAPEKAYQSTTNANHTSANIYTLPSEERAWMLIRGYFQKTGQLLPFIHEEAFCNTYIQMKHNHFKKARRTWLGLLNIIFAMATTLSVSGYHSAEQRIKESEVYYQRANALCDKESKRNISLELVQYLLILGQYLQGTQKSVQAWTVHGLAITTALQLGLHSPKTNTGFPAIEAEIRKRVWYGCILLDRTLSMTFGRPSMIHDKLVRLELPTSDMQILGQTLQSDPVPQMDAMCFTATIKLYNVMYHIIDTCYGSNLGIDDFIDDSEILSLVLSAERQLDALKPEIIYKLRLCIYDSILQRQDLESMQQENLIVERFNIVVSLRYHNVRILLHRPILERILDASTGCISSNADNKSIIQQIGIRNIEACVESAKIIISAVHTVVLSSDWRQDLLGAWNYSLFYTFNAGLVLFASLLVAPRSIKETSRQMSTPWSFIDGIPQFLNMAIEALRHLDCGNRVIFRCVEYLSQLCTIHLNSCGSLKDGVTNVPNFHNSEFYTGDQAQMYISTTGQPFSSQDLLLNVDLNEFMLDTDFAHVLQPY